MSQRTSLRDILPTLTVHNDELLHKMASTHVHFPARTSRVLFACQYRLHGTVVYWLGWSSMPICTIMRSGVSHQPDLLVIGEIIQIILKGLNRD